MTLTLTDGTPVSRFAYGTMQWGGRASDAESRAMYDACRAVGINHFDTAVAYAGGASETLLGRFAAADRERLYIATKVAYKGGSGRDNILAQLDTSRRQLGLDSVDLLYLHRWDGDTPLEETFATMAELREQGRIRHIGVSNYAAWQTMKAQAVCAGLGIGIDAIQPMLSLVKRQAEVEILPMAADQGIAALTYSPLGGGLLTGKYAGGGAGRLTEDRNYAARYAPGWMHEAAQGLAAIAAETGHDAATLAVAWVATHPLGPRPIISARTVDQLRPSLDAMDLPLDPDLRARLSALTPTPAPATDRLEEA